MLPNVSKLSIGAPGDADEPTLPVFVGTHDEIQRALANARSVLYPYRGQSEDAASMIGTLNDLGELFAEPGLQPNDNGLQNRLRDLRALFNNAFDEWVELDREHDFLREERRYWMRRSNEEYYDDLATEYYERADQSRLPDDKATRMRFLENLLKNGMVPAVSEVDYVINNVIDDLVRKAGNKGLR